VPYCQQIHFLQTAFSAILPTGLFYISNSQAFKRNQLKSVKNVFERVCISSFVNFFFVVVPLPGQQTLMELDLHLEDLLELQHFQDPVSDWVLIKF